MQILIDFCDARARLNGTGAVSVSTDGHSVNAASASADPITRTALRCAFNAPRQTLVAHTPDQVKPVLDAVDAFARQGLWCVGYLRYEAASAFDAALQTHAADGPLAWFGVYDQALPWPQDTLTPTSAAQPPNTPARTAPSPHTQADIIRPAPQYTQAKYPLSPPPGAPANSNTAPPLPALAPTTVQWQRPLTRPQFDANMHSIHQAIAAGEFYQVNYTAPLRGDFTGSAPELFERLQRAQPGGYAAYIDTGAEQILSVSPELFFDWDGSAAGGHILTRPMKGTAARGATPEEDAALAHGLTQSPKERAENVMIVDLLRNDLSRIAQPHSVQVPRLFAVQSLPTVHQMVSDVTAQTRPGIGLSDVFGALFPCGSITGAPKVRAMQMIRTLEPAPRGVYCGAIGVVRPGGHATFNVAIRTVSLQGTQASCGIGSGITADATAAAEWQEWQHKRGFLERASDSFALLETLRLENRNYSNLIAHCGRLERAARHFGYVFDKALVDQALKALADEAAAQAWRVRLLLQANGQVRAEKHVLNSSPTLVTLRLAATCFEAAHSEFTRFKTTRRAHYEAFAPTDPEVFDTLLYNAQGELTECTRGNIAVLLDGQWLTPALHCGLLPGVGRAAFIARGRLTEATITLADLPRVQGWAFVNSLRGWVDARL
jgi:para-aminobenzoate synthetase/4-amino-4-deoxychorismate lyase